MGDSPALALYAQFAELGAIGALLEKKRRAFGGAGSVTYVVFEALAGGRLCESPAGRVLVGRPRSFPGTAAQKAKLEDIVAGRAYSTTGTEERQPNYGWSNWPATAAKCGHGWTLNGRQAVVAFGRKAILLRCRARTAGGRSTTAGSPAFLVDGNAPAFGQLAYSASGRGRRAE
ncbi:hypothetical protein [Comamonas terrigena]|uniref:Uncharacterized protein n=1 Tax=Comamonas terrigena TaxID=32013 RepID=A0A2A7UPK9_COMTR|nr:hypothetical protein [Comamonas terrigena]PEH87217.1 hypothetical protein CRM82_00025 [Comamonas terrigena]